MSEIVQWLIRKQNGEIDGPMTTVDVIRKIRSGSYMGEEFLSRYPSGRWYPISYDQNFFNILLEVLEQDLLDKPSPKKEERDEVTQRIASIKKDFEAAQTQKIELGAAVFEDLDAKTPVVIEVEPENKEAKSKNKKDDSPAPGKAVKERASSQKSKRVVGRVKPKTRRGRRSQLQLLIFAAVIAIVGFSYFLLHSEPLDGERIRLRRPNYTKGETLNKNQIGFGMRRAIQSFRRDSVKDYLIAQDALVEIVEKSNSLDAYSFLCMTYRELWPFSYQDGQDLDTLQKVLGRVQKLNPKSISASICLVVSHWVKGQYDDALRIMDSHLLQSPGLLFFNQMTGDIYAARKDYRSAVYYFSKVRELWAPPPVWSKALLEEARMYRMRGVFGTAIKLYRKLLSENPDHAVAKIEMGLVEFNPYQNIARSQDFIRSGLTSKQFIPKMIEAEAYVTLAKISILQGNNAQALKLAQRGFSVDSSNQEARELIVSMGGIKALNAVNIDNVNMIYLGEQYMKMNNYGAAQAEFRAAFEANKKNGFAALRAGEALWQLNQSNEAMTWVKKSIEADPYFIRSYLILSDYQSARFDYINAIETLKNALRIDSRHHGIFAGFALIELRRRNYEGAIQFAKKALELYDTDIESLLIISSAHQRLNSPEEGFKYIQQALELDNSNEDVHIAFAFILASLQGTDAGINYLDGMISQSGKIDYMRALGELLSREERNQEAIQYYSDALTKDPKDKKTLMALSKILQRDKRYDEARDFLLEAAALDPSDAEPLFLIGQLYLDSGRNDFALTQFERVITVNPNFPLAHYYAGLTQIALKRPDEALSMAFLEKKMNPELPEAYLLSAEAYFLKKQYNLCSEEYQRVLAKGLKTAEVFIKLARCYRLSGSFDSAMTMLTEAETRESGNSDIYKELGALYQEKGEHQKSLESYRRYLQLNPQAPDKVFIEQQIKKIEKGDENG